MEWYKEEYDKYITWNDSNLTKLPFIIKHEYLRVFELLLNGQVYGVFFQIKDTFEIVLKSLILTVISEMLENNQLSGADNDIVFKLFEKALSLGDWEGISRLLKNKSQYSEINALINSIISIYGDNSITKWRNDFIGHGALPNSESEYFINEIRQKIKILQSYFEENIVHYEAIEYIPQKNTLVFKYKNDLIFDLKYFSYYENENIYIFDSFNSLKKKFAFLNYSNGRKSEIASKQLIDLVDRLQFDNKNRIFKTNIEDDVFSVIEDRIINEISKIDDFIRPEFIISELVNFIEHHDKGIFLLQMEKGMGKTVLSNALDQHGLNKIKINNCIVRGYYVNDTYKSSKSAFVSELNDLFRIDKEGRILYRGNIPYIEDTSTDPKSQVAKLLSFYRDKYYDDLGKEKLIFFVDGLDEIVPQKDGSIFDYLPNESDLEKNIYIIYTSRTNKELEDSFFNLNNLSKISYTENLEIKKDSPEYKEILISFLKKKYKGIENEKVSGYLDMASFTFQSLKRICNASDSNRLFKIENIFTNIYYEEEVSSMYDKFGSQHFERILNVLLLLSLCNEPLNISVISYLLMDEKANFELLFYINHLRLFLTAERTIHGNFIELSDSGLRKYLIENHSENVTNISNLLVSKCLAELSKQKCDEKTTNIIISNLDILLTYSDFKIDDFKEEAILKRLLEIESGLSRHEVISLKRVSRIQSQILNILESSEYSDQKYSIYKAILKSNQAEVYDLLGFTDRASQGFSESVSMLNKLEIDELPFAMLLSSRTYIKYALLCIKTNENKTAIISLNNALKLYQGLEEAKVWKPSLRDYLYIYNNRGIAYQNLRKLAEAEVEYNTAISMLSEHIDNMDDELKLAASMIYLNRGTIFLIKGPEQFDQALSDFYIAYKYVDYVTEIFSEQKSKILVNKSIVLLDIESEEKHDSLSDINSAISILEGLMEKNMLIDDEILMNAYINNGIILNRLGQKERVISCYNNAIRIGEKLKNAGRYINSYEFCKVKFLLALMHGEFNNPNEEVRVYKDIIKTANFDLRELLLIYLSSFNNFISLITQETRSIHMNFVIPKLEELLLKKYNDLNREELLIFLSIINDVTEFSKGKKLYEKAIDYQKCLLSCSDLLVSNTEIKSVIMKEIGDCFLNQNKLNDALYYYNQSIELMSKMEPARFELQKQRAEMLYNRSIIHCINKLFQRAFDDAYESLSITNLCLENEIIIKPEYTLQRASHLKSLYASADKLGILVH